MDVDDSEARRGKHFTMALRDRTKRKVARRLSTSNIGVVTEWNQVPQSKLGATKKKAVIKPVDDKENPTQIQPRSAMGRQACLTVTNTWVPWESQIEDFRITRNSRYRVYNAGNSGHSKRQHATNNSSFSMPIAEDKKASLLYATVPKPMPSTASTSLPEPVLDMSIEEESFLGEEYEYAPDILTYGRALEKKHQTVTAENLFSEHFKPRMRAVLFDWLIQVTAYFGFEDKTLHLAARLMDRILVLRYIPVSELQLVAVAAIWLGAKCEEKEVPLVSRLLRLTQNNYTRKQLYMWERFILLDLQFELAIMEPTLFLDNYLLSVSQEDPQDLRSLCMYALDSVLPTVVSAVALPSIQAASALYTALIVQSSEMDMQADENVWKPQLAAHSDYSEVDIRPITMQMLQELSQAPTSQFKGVYEKYSSQSKFKSLSKSPKLDPERLRLILSTQFNEKVF